MQTIVKLFAKYINAVAPAKIKIVYEKIFTRPVLIAQDSKNQSPKQHSKVSDRVDHPGLSRRNSQTGNYGSQSERHEVKVHVFPKEKPVAVDAITRF